jgi:hypothetical protein
MPVRKILGLLFLFVLVITGNGYSQSSQALYLYHEGSVPTPKTFQENKPRPWKMSIDAGWLFGFTGSSGYTSHYVSGLSANSGYTFGLIEEIPVQKRSSLNVGVEILKDGVTFSSYYFAPGYSFLYNGVESYLHTVTMNEIQVPVIYKFPLGPTDRKNRLIFMTFGAKFRYISYTNTAITSDSTGYLVWDGAKDVSSLYRLFSPFGSSVFEMSLGYQRNTKKKRKRGWYMSFEYNYGLSPLVYTGNNEGSNYVVFHLNSLIFKIGKIF